MKLHVLAIPHTVTSKEYLSCAFTQKVLKFCKMMNPHYEIIHYGHEKSDVICIYSEKYSSNKSISRIHICISYYVFT